MDSRKLAIEKIIKYFLLVFCVYVLYILQGTPGFFEILGVKPVFIIPFCINLAMLEEEQYALIVYVAGGMLMELSAGRIVGFYTIPILIACTISGIMVKYIFKANYRNTIGFSFACTIIILTVDFFFSYVLQGDSNLIIYLKTVAFSSVYSAVFSPAYFKVISRIQRKFIKFNAR